MTEDPGTFWDERVRAQGHTGWANPLVYRYDQPLRLRAVMRTVRGLYPDLRGVHALDLGCGTGDMSLALADAGAGVLGTDISADVIKLARARVGTRDNLRFAVSTVNAFDAAAASYDLALSVTVLQHMTDDELGTALHRLAVLLRPGGHLVALEMAPVGGTAGPNAGHLTARTPSAWFAAFQDAGLERVSLSSYPQWSITLLEKISRRLRSAAPRIGSNPVGGEPPALRSLAVPFVLAAGAPLDRLLRLPTPGRWASYRIMVVRRP